jgi:hypothetical protein
LERVLLEREPFRRAIRATEALTMTSRIVATLLVISATASAQRAPAKDPHAGQFSEGTGRRCATCHGKTPHAEDMYRAAAHMEKMTTELSKGTLKPYGGITCFTCHRGGGPDHNMAHPMPLNRTAVRAMMNDWPAEARSAPDATRLTMSEYSVSLGVKCGYCHVQGNWKADTKPPMKVMSAMETLMKEFPKYFDFAKASVFTCFTCHQGAVKVAR